VEKGKNARHRNEHERLPPRATRNCPGEGCGFVCGLIKRRCVIRIYLWLTISGSWAHR